MQRSILH